MNCKTRAEAIAKLEGYSGFVFQYVKTGRWNWATKDSQIGKDLANGDTINPNGLPMFQIPVQQVEFVEC